MERSAPPPTASAAAGESAAEARQPPSAAPGTIATARGVPASPQVLPAPSTSAPIKVAGRLAGRFAQGAPMATVLGLAVLLVWGAGEWATRNELETQWDNLRRSGEVQALALRGVATRYNYLPFTAAQQPLVETLLKNPGSPLLRDAANAYLQAVSAHAGSEALYILDTQGLTLAASNWDTPHSFVHHNYGNRPYFRDALAGRTGRFYGVGKTTGEPGLFVSAPVMDGGQVMGVVAVKVNLQAIVSTWAALRDPVLVTDERGIVFLGSVKSWLYRTRSTLSPEAVQQVRREEQYGGDWQPTPVPWTWMRRAEPGMSEIRDADGAKHYLALDETLADLGWTLTLTADIHAVALARQQAWALASLASGLLVLGALYWQLRERRMRENRQARVDLERRVDERTQALQQSEAFRQSMENALLVGMRARDLSGRVVYVNAAMCEMLGYRADEMIGQGPPYPYWPSEAPEPLATAPAHSTDAGPTSATALQGFESRLRHRNGTEVHAMVYTARLFDGQGRHTGWMSSVVDTTAQKRAEEQQRQREAQLQRVQRVITVGEMASTLAHELNQPLAALVNYAAACRALADQGQTEPLLASLQALSQQAQRAADIVGRIRQWVRQHPETREPCDLNATVHQSLALLLRAEARRQGVPVHLALCSEPLRVTADRVLLEQVVLNLGLNALQAMQLHALTSAPPELLLRTLAAPNAALLQVLDRGPGLPPEIEERLFEPFFTTRSDGLGLGLNICRSIVESMGGELLARNRPGGGALFEIRLPLLHSASPATPPMKPSHSPQHCSPSHPVAAMPLGDSPP